MTRSCQPISGAVVHGDAPEAAEIRRAFFAVERHLLEIYLGFLALYAGITRTVDPQSVRPLRRALRERIDLFFWSPDLM